jgi:hypothetical protein
MFELVIKHSRILEIPEKGEEMYIEHNHNIRRLAKQYDRPLLEFNVRDGWGPLCEFLGKSIPTDEEGREVPFPKMNGGEVYAGMNDAFQGQVLREALGRMALWAGAVCFAVLGLWSWKRFWSLRALPLIRLT